MDFFSTMPWERPRAFESSEVAIFSSMGDPLLPAVGAGIVQDPAEMTEALRAKDRADEIRRTQGREACSAFLASLPPNLTPAGFGGQARIGVAPETAPLTWDDFMSLGAIDSFEGYLREFYDRAAGSDPEDWRLSRVPVPRDTWIAVETRSGMVPGKRWAPYAPRESSCEGV